MKTAIEIAKQKLKPFNEKFIADYKILEAMEEYADQNDKAIEAIKKRISELKHEFFETESRISVESYGSKMSELNNLLKILTHE